jgi:hypothetical protein
MKYEQYKTLGTLQNAIVNSIKTKIDTDGDITFSLSNDMFFKINHLNKVKKSKWIYLFI